MLTRKHTIHQNGTDNILIAAIGGLAIAVGYGAYKFSRRGKMSPSVFLMQLRVGAQGVAVGTLTLGLLYNIITEHVLKKD